jgi:tRNA threonylcarbamoyl adenosine modification protein YeaZ
VLVLALDTSGAAVAVALVESTTGQPLAVRQVLGTRGHGEHLSPSISACLAEAGAVPGDLGAVVAGLGPGPFTGLRVGLVTAAALGDALGIATYGVCSLDAVAAAISTAKGDLLVATDARRREVYWARYRDGARIDGPHVSAPSEVPVAGIAAMTGAGARQYADVLGLPLLDIDLPDPRQLARIASARIESGAPSEALTPLYLRRPDAVVPAALKTVTQ